MYSVSLSELRESESRTEIGDRGIDGPGGNRPSCGIVFSRSYQTRSVEGCVAGERRGTREITLVMIKGPTGPPTLKVAQNLITQPGHSNDEPEHE